MKMSIDGEVVFEPRYGFRGAPGTATEPIYVRSKHGASVVEAEKRIKPDLF